jgi:hypothetical protein
VAAPITLLIPGAGPPPTKMPTLVLSVMYAAGYTRICGEKSLAGVTTQRVGETGAHLAAASDLPGQLGR